METGVKVASFYLSKITLSVVRKETIEFLMMQAEEWNFHPAINPMKYYEDQWL